MSNDDFKRRFILNREVNNVAINKSNHHKGETTMKNTYNITLKMKRRNLTQNENQKKFYYNIK